MSLYRLPSLVKFRFNKSWIIVVVLLGRVVFLLASRCQLMEELTRSLIKQWFDMS